MLVRIKLAALSAVFLLAGCATAYQPEGISGGYSDQKLSEDTARVSFRGNRLSSAETLHSYLLRRCADVTLESGYNYFVLVSNEAPNERNADIFGGNSDSATIKMYKDRRPASAYDAAALVRSIPVASGEMGEAAAPPNHASAGGGKGVVNPNAPTNEPPSFENMY